MTEQATPIVQLIDAVDTLLANIVNANEHGPFGVDETDPEEVARYAKDEDGDYWFRDVWELNQVVEEVRKDVRVYNVAPQLLAACQASAASAHHPDCPVVAGKTATHDACTCHVGIARKALEALEKA